MIIDEYTKRGGMSMVIENIKTFLDKYIGLFIESNFFSVWKTVAIAVGIFVLILFVKNIFTKYIIKALERILNKTKVKSGTMILTSFERPIRLSFIVVGVYIFSVMVTRALGFNISSIINKLLGTSIIALFTMGLVNVAGNSDEFLSKASSKYDIKVNTVLIPTLSKGIKFLIIAFAVIQVANIWGLDVNAFITGIGLGGVVIALAAKDFAANMMSGVIIFIDSPFTIGDWIKCNQLEGIVEEISFRSTRIRTFDKVLISVPNSVLANEPIFNYNKRKLRRVTMDIGLTYDTGIDKLHICLKRIRSMLFQNEGVDNEGITVNFDRFGDSSLDITMYFFINKVSFNEFMDIKEKINYEIMKILEEEEVHVAYPTSTIYLQNK